jgi:NlpC/P60 family
LKFAFRTRIGSVAVLAVVAAGASLALAGPAAASPMFSTMNDAGGIYWRSAPDWNTPVAQSGNGFYPGTSVAVSCYQHGTTVPGSANTMWVQATWVGGPGHGSGWIDEHFINDGAAINQAAAGVPACGSVRTPPPPVTSTADRAIGWMSARMGSTSYDGLCLAAVYQAYLSTGVNVTSGLPYAASHGTAYSYWTVARNRHPGDHNPPRGALVFFHSYSGGAPGHVAISLGNGQMISTYDGRTHGIHVMAISSYDPRLFLGWVGV